MAEVKWIKLMVDVFSNRKIEQIEAMPDGDGIIVIWFKLLCLAGTLNDDGAVYFTQELPYTEEMLAAHFHRPLQLVRLALRIFAQFGMIEIVDDIIHISNWAKYQNVEGMQRVREQTRERVAAYRQRKRLASGQEEECNVTCNATVTQSNATEEEEEEDIEKENKSVCGADAPPPDESLKKKKPIRKKYGQYGRVLLTDEEHARLLKDLGNEELSRCIQYIDESAQSTGNKNGWKDWNLVLRRCSKQKWGLGYNARAAPTKISANKEYEQEDWHGQQR